MKRPIFVVAFAVLVAAGCNHNPSGPMNGQSDFPASGGVAVKVVASPTSQVTTSRSTNGFSPRSVLAAVDSVTIDGATLILEDIAFTSDIDTVHPMDSLDVEKDDESGDQNHDGGDDHHGDEGESGKVRIKGPFIVALQDNQPVQVAVDTIPPGTYNGIRFVIHRLRQSDVMRNPSLPDSLLGFSLVVTGSVQYADSSVVPFVFKTDINEEFKVKGNFVVLPGDRNVPYALDFNITGWFKDPTGRTLDPNNKMDRMLIRQAIRATLGGHMRGGRDGDHDGRPD